jgi:hypothetical protein
MGVHTFEHDQNAKLQFCHLLTDALKIWIQGTLETGAAASPTP